jgi:hypothetical protein
MVRIGPTGLTILSVSQYQQAGLKGGDVQSVKVHTGFGGGIGGDNWNVQRIQLKATLK